MTRLRRRWGRAIAQPKVSPWRRSLHLRRVPSGVWPRRLRGPGCCARSSKSDWSWLQNRPTRRPAGRLRSTPPRRPSNPKSNLGWRWPAAAGGRGQVRRGLLPPAPGGRSLRWPRGLTDHSATGQASPDPRGGADGGDRLGSGGDHALKARPSGQRWGYVKAHGCPQEAKRLVGCWQEKLAPPSISPEAYDLVIDPSHLWLTIHESAAHGSEAGPRASGSRPAPTPTPTGCSRPDLIGAGEWAGGASPALAGSSRSPASAALACAGPHPASVGVGETAPEARQKRQSLAGAWM